jgi:hypothetical protein
MTKVNYFEVSNHAHDTIIVTQEVSGHIYALEPREMSKPLELPGKYEVHARDGKDAMFSMEFDKENLKILGGKDDETAGNVWVHVRVH